MQRLKEQILEEGKNLGDGILKIDSILNHQIHPDMMQAIGDAIAEQFRDIQPTRILTAEVSGIAPALMTAQVLGIPVVYARKKKPITMFGPVFMETAVSHTKGGETLLLVSAEYLPPGEKVLIVDDFLATGITLNALCRMVLSAECQLVGVAAVVEKTFEGGRKLLESKYPNIRLKSLVQITNMDNGKLEIL